MSRVRPRRPLAVVAVIATLLVGAFAFAADAAAPPPVPAGVCGPEPGSAVTPVIPTINRVGIIDLHFLDAQGGLVSYFECIATRAIALGRRAQPGHQFTVLRRAAVWRCDRLARRFAATVVLPDGTVGRGVGSTRTVSCAKRFALELARRVAPGRLLKVVIRDQWKLGDVRPQLCVTPPRGRRTCREVRFAGHPTVSRRLRLRTRGRWAVRLRLRGASVRAWVAVGVPSLRTSAPPTVLATGDSTMEGVSSFLSDDLGATASTVSDVRPGFSISRTNGWTTIARAQVKRLRPATTVVSIGANEGLPMTGADGTTHSCCDDGWVDEMRKRMKAAMTTYRRGGRARVFWMTLVAPKDPRRVALFNAVNTAILDAAAGVPGVRILRMDLLFSPDGYRTTIRDGGRDVHVREPDGIHLSVAGTKIAAREIVKAMRAS